MAEIISALTTMVEELLGNTVVLTLIGLGIGLSVVKFVMKQRK